MKICIPDMVFDRVVDIGIDILKEKNIKGLLLDIDNTLARTHDPNPFDGIDNWVFLMKNNNIKMVLISNNKEPRVKAFAEIFGLEYIYSSRKPLKKNILKGCRMLNFNKENIAIVGDQIFTDILGGNLSKIKSFLVLTEHQNAETNYFFVIKRKLEKIFINKYNRKLNR